LTGSSRIILSHNHPSGDTNPSDEDINITKQLKKAGELIGIEVLDHVIVGKRGYWSYVE
jgi:DNA repair protein RadC